MAQVPMADKRAGIGMGSAAPEQMGMMPVDAGAGVEPGMEEEAGPESNVPEEEQAMYDKFMENYLRVMYDKGTSKGEKGEPALIDDVRDMLKNVEDPVFALGTAAETIVGFLADSAEQAGKPISPDVLMHATNQDVIPDLAELSEKSGYHDYTPEEMAAALQVGMSLYIEERKDRIDMNAFKQDMQMLQQADQAGNIEEIVPGITELASKAPAAPPEEAAPAPGPPAPGLAAAKPMPGGRRI